MKDTNSRTSPRRILNILEEIIIDPDNFTAKKISHKLNIPFKPVHASTRDFPHWENYLPKSKDEKVLIVDDICDSGETFERLSEYIKENINHECDVRFVSLWWNNECDFEPHYYIRDLAKDTENVWVDFPHESWWKQ